MATGTGPVGSAAIPFLMDVKPCGRSKAADFSDYAHLRAVLMKGLLRRSCCPLVGDNVAVALAPPRRSMHSQQPESGEERMRWGESGSFDFSHCWIGV